MLFSIIFSILLGPSLRPQTTKIPTDIKATNLTIASKAMAVTTPWCRSLASKLRVPNNIVNKARPAAMNSAVITGL